MGACDEGRNWIPMMYSGNGDGDLVSALSGMELREGEKGNNEGLIHVIEALEEAESAIKQQLKENIQLKNELRRLTPELERYKLEAISARTAAVSTHDHAIDLPQIRSSSSVENDVNGNRWVDNGSSVDPQGTVAIGQNGVAGTEVPSLGTSIRDRQYHESSKVNGSLQKSRESLYTVDDTGPSQFSTPSHRSFSPNRHQVEGESNPIFNVSVNNTMPMSDPNANILWKQQLALKVREQEEEITRLKNYLADYSVKEAQTRNEKYVLESRISQMRRAFDQQQEDLIDATSKAISYRQEIVEENIRLTYALQAAQAEKSTYLSSLLPLLSEYGLQPTVQDAQSIVSSLKVLFTHMQERLFMIETSLVQEKLRDSQYHLIPWQTESTNITGFTLQSPSHPRSAQYGNNLEIVPQPAYAHAQSPISSPNTKPGLDLEITGNQNLQPSSSVVVGKNQEYGTMERTSQFIVRNPRESSSTRVDQSGSNAHFSSESNYQNLSFKNLVQTNKTDDSETTAVEHVRERNVHWASGNSPYSSAAREDPNSYPYLPPVLEEPGSSFSEAAEDDPLPAIDGLRISGEPYPGRVLLASGYSINGTKSCNFEWVRYLEDGSVQYIEGAKQPNYLVNADDVNSYLAIEVQPLDDRMRKGELVTVFANEKKKITCDPEMQEQIKQTLSIGQISYDVSSEIKLVGLWEPAVLAIKREGYSIKSSRGVLATEKFKSSTNITIPYGQPGEFIIQDGSAEFLLKTEVSSQLRDVIVLTMRLFKTMALEKRKGKKKGLFFLNFD